MIYRAVRSSTALCSVRGLDSRLSSGSATENKNTTFKHDALKQAPFLNDMFNYELTRIDEKFEEHAHGTGPAVSTSAAVSKALGEQASTIFVSQTTINAYRCVRNGQQLPSFFWLGLARLCIQCCATKNIIIIITLERISQLSKVFERIR